MTVTVTTTGNGKFILTDQSDAIIDYSMTESATPTGIENMDGEIPTMSITGASNTVQTISNTHPHSRLLIDNQLTMTDSKRGTFVGKVGSLSLDTQTVSADVFSPFDKLNVTKRVDPFHGTLKAAFEAYLASSGLTSGQYSVDASFTDNVVFPGWNDTIWNGLKMLCVAVNAEMYFISGVIYVKPRGLRSIIMNNIDSESFGIELGQKSKKSKFTRNKTQWVSGAIVYTAKPKDSSESIDYNETKDITLTSKVSLASVNQPEYAQFVFDTYVDYVQGSAIGTVPTEYLNGFYTFRNKNGDIVPAASAAQFGAKVTAALTDNPYEIKLTITGPTIQYATPWSLEFRDDYPSLGLTGTGTLVESDVVEFATGSAIGDEENEYTDNPFLVMDKYLQNTAYYTNQEICGPNTTFSFATDKIEEANNQEFGYLPGAIFSYGGSKYRISSASYTYSGISIDAKQYVTFADFNAKWSGKTYAQFNSTMLDPTAYPNSYMKHSDFAILPLMEPVA